jgi:hypothetical protein
MKADGVPNGVLPSIAEHNLHPANSLRISPERRFSAHRRRNTTFDLDAARKS